MTTNQQPRRLRRPARDGNGQGGASATPIISERLRAAREARGVDLFRVERDTKIRIKYLTAIETGAFSELPAEVYVRGFLRNYATYLGLDPDEAESEWRRDKATRRPSPPPAQPTAFTPPPPPAAGLPPVQRPAWLKVPSVKWPGREGPTPPPAELAARAATAQPQFEEFSGEPARPAVARRSRATGGTPAIDPAELETTTVRPSAWSSRAITLRFPDIPLPGFMHRGDDREVQQYIGPQPLETPRRALLLQPIHIVLLLMAVLIVVVGAFWAFQAQRVVQDPTLTVTAPNKGYTDVAMKTTTFTLTGKATVSSQISIKIDGRDPMFAQADKKSGLWSYKVTLHSGVNQFEVFSTDMETNHNSATVVRYINVPAPSASPVPMLLSIDSPADGSYFKNGSITVTGSSVAITSVTITPTYLGLAPANAPTPGPSRTPSHSPTPIPTLAPTPTAVLQATPQGSPTATPKPTPVPTGALAPVQVIPTIDGKFSVPLRLYSGRWKLTAVGTNKDGIASEPVSINVTVTAGSLTVVFTPNGAGVYLKIWRDGRLYKDMASYPSRGQVKIVADQSVWVYTNNPYKTLVMINGVSLGRIGTSHTAGSWRITAYGPPVPSNDA
jgi:hypothetical protein